MEVQAVAKSVRISPRKVRFVADAIRSQSVERALVSLHMTHKRAAGAIEKTLRSAMANATNNAKLDRATLVISKIEVTEGPAFKRYHPSTRGRIHPYKRRSSHIRIIVSGSEYVAATKAPVKKADAEVKPEKKEVSKKAEKPSIAKKTEGKGGKK